MKCVISGFHAATACNSYDSYPWIRIYLQKKVTYQF